MSEKTGGKAIDWSAIIAVLSLLCGAVWVNQGGEDRRPTPDSSAVEPGRGIQDADARLWQDPFNAVKKYQENQLRDSACYHWSNENKAGSNTEDICFSNKSNTEPDSKNIQKLIEARLSGGKATVTVLAVMANGGNTPGSDELRRRTRYAVLAGIKAEHFEPDDAEHLGHFLWDFRNPDAAADSTNTAMKTVVPFEWFHNAQTLPDKLGVRGRKNARILLLWLNDDAINEQTYDGQTHGKVSEIISKPTPLRKIAALFYTLSSNSIESGID